MRGSVCWILAIVVATYGCGHRNGQQPLDFESCAGATQSASFAPVSLLFAVDRSGSMSEGEPVPKWEATTDALRSFIEAKGARTLSVALRLWPDAETLGGCNRFDCDATSCSEPQVPLGSLADPGHVRALLVALAATQPDGTSTPLSAVVEGTGQWAQDNPSTNQTPAAVVLVTDGIPQGCNESTDVIAELASESAEDGAPVFVVGLEGSREDDLDYIAERGGTQAAFFIGNDVIEEDLLAALETIQGEVLSCTLPLPKGNDLDYTNIRVEARVGDARFDLSRFDGAPDCDGTPGWHLEGDRIALCPSTCVELQTAPEVAIEISVGCDGTNAPGEPFAKGGAWSCHTTGPSPARSSQDRTNPSAAMPSWSVVGPIGGWLLLLVGLAWRRLDP